MLIFLMSLILYKKKRNAELSVTLFNVNPSQ